RWRRVRATPLCPRRILTPTAISSSSLRSACLLTSLSSLAADLLTLVTHALALVRVGLAQLADLGGGLADLLLVDARHREAGRRLDVEGDAVGGLDQDRMAEPQGEFEVASL